MAAEAIGVGLSGCDILCTACAGGGHIIRTLVFGLIANAFDVGSDLLNAFQYYRGTTVKRTLLLNSSLLANGSKGVEEVEQCLDFKEDQHPINGSLFEFECNDPEQDIFWAILTVAFIQVPGVVLFLCTSFALLITSCMIVSEEYRPHPRHCWLMLTFLLVPFPLVVAIQQMWTLCHPSDQMEVLGAILLFGEGALEASPNLLLSLYIILSDWERGWNTILFLSAVSSAVTITKTSVDMYCSESYRTNATPNDLIHHTASQGDSLLKGKGLCASLATILKISPAFFLSLVHRVGSIAVVTTMWQHYAVIFIAVGLLLTFIVVFRSTNYLGAATDVRAGLALFYVLTNVTILAKCPLGNRHTNHQHMIEVTWIWSLLHGLVLGYTSLMIHAGGVGTGNGYFEWREPWANHYKLAILSTPWVFYLTCAILVALGPLTHLALVMLQKIMVAEDKKGEGGAWGKKQGMKGEAVGAWAGEMGEQVQLNKRHIGIM